MGAGNAKNGCFCLYGGLWGVLLSFIAAGALETISRLANG